MTCTAATFPGVTAFDRRIFAPVFAPVFALADYGRPICRAAVIGLGTVTAAGVMAGAVTVSAAGIIAVIFATNPNLKATTPMALETAALIKPYSRLADAGGLSGLAGIWVIPPMRRMRRKPPPYPPAHAGEGREEVAAVLPSAPTSTPQLPPNRPSERADDVPLPSPRPLGAPQTKSQHKIAGPPAEPALPQVAAAPPPRRESTSFNLFQKRFTPQQPRNNSISLPGPDSRTAIYDIEAHTVYLPNGLRLEAHSGLGRRLDDPRYVNEKGRGATPPNVYDLVLRNEPFHGVRAIRLNPVDDGRMFGRDGILAHTYMLGPTGQSFGCVSFKNYPEFLEAFLRGEIDRLVVVPHLETKPSEDERARRGNADRYAFDNR